MNIKTVTVIGATGTMGANVAGIFASFGGAKVYCVARNLQKVEQTIPRIVKSVRADSIRENLIAADFSMLEQCVADSDLVFESLFESMDIKLDIASKVNRFLKSEAISCTGTSGLSVHEISLQYDAQKRKNFYGVHMFNPPYNMALCELIPTEAADAQQTKQLREYLENTLHRTVVEVKDSPAFLGNRIGFQFINQALQFAEKYQDNGGIDYIDAILGPFSGRAMAPLMTADFVGLDIHKAIVNNIYSNTHDYAHETFRLPEYALRLIQRGKLGRKAGGGLYERQMIGGERTKRLVYDLETDSYREIIKYEFPFAKKMNACIYQGDYTGAFTELVNNHSNEARICLCFLLQYIVYAVYTAKQIGDTIAAADDAMATGFNWCPPIALYELIESVADFRSLVKELLPALYEQADVEQLFANVEQSKYDYRKFLKSAR